MTTLPSLISTAMDSITDYEKYIWCIPSMTHYEKIILCNGYVKQNYNEYVTTPIIELFAYYYTNDDYGLNNILNASHKQKFVSPIFSIGNFKWYLEVYPNGSNSSTQGEVILYICLAMLPPQLSKITAQFKLTLSQTCTTYRDIAAFSFDDSYGGWPRHTLSLHDLKNSTTNKLKFILEMNILNVYDQTQNVIPNYFDRFETKKTAQPIEYLPIVTYNWDINDMKSLIDAKLCQQFNGPLAKLGNSLAFYLRVYPNGASSKSAGKIYIGLKLLFWPSNISKMLVQCKLSIAELKLCKSGPKCFDSTHLSLSWNTTQNISVLSNLNYISFTMELRIIDILNMDGISIISSNYISDYKFKYFSESNVSQYNWQINDSLTLSKICSSKMGDTFNSELFKLGSHFSMYLQFRPTVSDESKVWLGLKLSHLPTKIAELVCKCKLIFEEANNSKTGYKCFQENHLGFAMNTRITRKDLINFKQLNFSFELSILDVIGCKKYEEFAPINKCDYMINESQPINKLKKLPMCKHLWNIKNETNIISKLKTASNVYCCVSPIFSAFGFKWYIGFWPNGSRESRAGHINLYLNCTSFMSLTLSIVVRYTLTLTNIQTNTFYHAFTSDANCWGRVKWMPATTNINKLNEFEFHANIELIDVYNNGEVITDKFLCLNNNNNSNEIIVPSQIIQWNVPIDNNNNNISYINGQGIYGPHFEMHGMIWYISLFVNGKNKNNEGNVEICINNLQLPTKESIVCLRYIIFVKETDTKYCAATTFSKHKLEETWGYERISTNKFKQLNKMTIELRMDLIDIYENEKNITKICLPNEYYTNYKLYKIKNNIKIIQQLTNKFELINNNINNNNCSNTQKTQLERNYIHKNDLLLWLKLNVGLEQYYDNFVNYYGINCMSIIKCITDNDLKGMGITVLQHRLRILIEISKLNVEKNNS